MVQKEFIFYLKVSGQEKIELKEEEIKRYVLDKDGQSSGTKEWPNWLP